MANLISKWSKPDTDIPSPTQFSLRPTVKMAAQINALTEMFPQRTKTDIINDLIEFGLKQVREEIAGRHVGTHTASDGKTDLPSYENQEDWDRFMEMVRDQEDQLMEKVQAEESKKKGGGKRKSVVKTLLEQ